MSDDEPKGLPPIEGSGPDGLPALRAKHTYEETCVDKARTCKSCGAEARIVSKSGYRQAYCGPCGIDWPIGPAPVLGISVEMPRGLSKQTRIEPDWDMAFEDIGGSDDSFGPKKKE